MLRRPSEERLVSRRAALRSLGFASVTALVAACTRPTAPVAPTAVQASAPKPTGAAQPASASATGTASAPAPASALATATASKPTAEQPKRGGTLRWGLLGNIVTLDGHNYGGTPHVFHVFDRLIVLDEQLNWVPRLAETWEINQDYTQIKLNLRKGVQYHTGREFTSEDVVWNFLRVKDPAVGGGIFASYVAPIKSVDATDKYSVVISTHQPYPYISHILEAMNMLDPVTMQQPDGVTKPVGTGPFKFVEFSQGDHLTLTRNANYWRSGLPYVDTLHMPIYSDPQTQVSALEGGAIDAAVNINVRDAARLRNDPKYQLILNRNAGALYVMQPNATLEPTSNKLLRQAIQYAIDRQRIVESVLLGLGEPTQLPWFPTSPAYDAARNRTYAFDLDKARSLVQQAGLSNVQLDFNYSSAVPEIGSMAQIIQADLAKIGVTLSLKPTQPPQLAAMQYGVTYNGLTIGTALFGQVQPGVQFGSPYYGPLNNWSGFKDDRFRELATALATETDAARAKQAYAAWSEYVLDQSFTIGVATLLPRVATTAQVRGVKYDMAYILDATEAWLA
jgi:peptide/nickel transport system substrate-binding protein